MINKIFDNILDQLESDYLTTVNQQEAEDLMSHFEDKFIEKFSSKNSFKYLCLRKNKSKHYYLELCYLKLGEWQKDLDDMSSFIKSYIGKQLILTLSNKVKSKIDLSNILLNIPITRKESSKEFTYHNDGNPLGSKNLNFSIGIGSYINVEGRSNGALGAIIKLKHDDNIYLITNFHVIMQGSKILDEKVFSNNTCVGRTYWGVNDNKFDVALAKLDKSIVNNIDYNQSNFGELIKPKIENKVCKFGPCGPSSGLIYSSKAVVKIRGGGMYKNQILIEGLHLNPSESGTIVKTNNDNVVGIHFAGDSKIDVSNNIYDLFKTKIEPYTDQNGTKYPKIEFETFINKN